MKTYLLVLSSLLLSIHSNGGVVKQRSEPQIPNKIDKLEIDNFKFLTDKTGVFLPEQLFQIPIGSKIKIFRVDGFCYEGKVVQIDKTPELYKIVSVFDNCKSAGVGIAITNKGECHGTLVDQDKNEKYSLEYSEPHKGWVFIKTVEKPPIHIQ